MTCLTMFNYFNRNMNVFFFAEVLVDGTLQTDHTQMTGINGHRYTQVSIKKISATVFKMDFDTGLVVDTALMGNMIKLGVIMPADLKTHCKGRSLLASNCSPKP